MTLRQKVHSVKVGIINSGRGDRHITITSLPVQPTFRGMYTHPAQSSLTKPDRRQTGQERRKRVRPSVQYVVSCLLPPLLTNHRGLAYPHLYRTIISQGASGGERKVADVFLVQSPLPRNLNDSHTFAGSKVPSYEYPVV